MPSKQPNSNNQLPDRLYGEHYPDSFLDVPRSIRQSSGTTLGDYIRHLQEVSNQPNKPCFACEPSQPDCGGSQHANADNNNFQHICPNNPILTCNCGNPNDCPELGNDPDQQSNEFGNKRCPDSNRICNTAVCPGECKGDGFADNLNYTGNPYPKREVANSGWPCVVVGGYNETSDKTAEHIYGTPDSSGFAK